MLAATAVTVQTVASGRSDVGSRVIEEPGEPLTEKLFGVPVGQSSVNELELTVTDSLKFTTTFVFTATWVAARPSGGSPVSTSLIPLARTVTVHVVAPGRSTVGSSVMVEVPEPLTLKACAEPLGHSSVNELALAFTGSLKVIVMLLLAFTPVAAFAGLVLETVGAASVVKEKL